MKEEDPGVKAIASSGYSSGPVMANFRERGFADVIPKPYRIEEMVYRLVQLTGKPGTLPEKVDAPPVRRP
ncbi:MAG: hypothetical protein A4E42_01154 [Methanoregulaceae archaeon PtaU1.Bin222]|nr:MAG: hypothetical protein A4E42_01154 [Methanoregulaceae archaeon PtaU1.Bin222]